MTGSKLIRNGPCGGVRSGGYCEVYPERHCVWTEAYQRSHKMGIYGYILDVQPAVDWRLEGTSAWINMLTMTDSPLQASHSPAGTAQRNPTAK